MAERRKVTTAFSEFDAELRRLVNLDEKNQGSYFAGRGRPQAGKLSKNQMHLVTEALFLRAFSRYEAFIEEVFILYCMEKKTQSGKSVKSHIRAKNYGHAKQIIKSSMNFLEWNNPDKIIERSRTYLEIDNPIFNAITQNKTKLDRMRKIRNAIAHYSEESELQFNKVLRDELGSLPLRKINVGEFLIMNDVGTHNAAYYLRTYFTVLQIVAEIAAG